MPSWHEDHYWWLHPLWGFWLFEEDRKSCLPIISSSLNGVMILEPSKNADLGRTSFLSLGPHPSWSSDKLFLSCFPWLCFWLRDLWLQRRQRKGLVLDADPFRTEKVMLAEVIPGLLLWPDAPSGWPQCWLFSLCVLLFLTSLVEALSPLRPKHYLISCICSLFWVGLFVLIQQRQSSDV